MSKPQRLPRPIQKQVDDANALLAQLNSKPGEGSPDGQPAAPAEAPSVDSPPEPQAVVAEQAPIEAPAVAVDQPPAPPTDDWKQRYDVLRGKYDKEIPELRVQVNNLAEKNRQNELLITQLNEKLDAAKNASRPDLSATTGTFTDEELQEYGKEFFDVVGRRSRQVAEEILAPVRSQLEKLNGATQQQTQTDAERARVSVYTELDVQVPDWKAINSDPAFLAWLDETDVFSTATKQELLTQALKANDAARVVRFFKAFQEDTAQAPTPAARQPAVDPGTLVAPGVARSGAPAVAPGGRERVWSQAEVKDFYTRVRRRQIPADERIRIEAEIVRAAAEGRVR